MEEWKEYKLGDVLCEKGYVRGPFGSALKRGDLLNEGIPVYEQQHAIYNKREFRFYISNEKYNEMKRFTVYPEDIIISCSGTVGEVSLIKNEDPQGIISQALLLLRANKNIILPEYLLYFFKTAKGHNSITSRSSGSVQVNIARREVIESIPLSLPSLDIQKKIVKTLKSLDDKIELNNRINHNLEEQAQALYKSWFIDFEPFKDGKFVDSELGMIPEGWTVKNLLELSNVFDSKRKPLSGNERSVMDKIYPYYGATSIMDYVSGYIFDGTYLLMGEDGSVITDEGFPFLQYVTGKFWPNNHAHVLQGKNGYSTEMLHCALLRKVVKASVTGAVQAKISQANMAKILFPFPSSEILKQFDDYIQVIYCQLRNIVEQNKNLTITRDQLLPKLLSGAITC